MSKTTLSTLQSEIKTEFEVAGNAEGMLEYLDKLIRSSMDDGVGQSARDSLSGIHGLFARTADEGLHHVEKAANALDNGYASADGITAQAEGILARARAMVRELGEA